MSATKGSWRVVARLMGREIVCGDIDIATVWGPERELDAIAALIASAPEQQAKIEALAQALERLWRFGHQCDDACDPDASCPHSQAEATLRLVGRL